MPADTAAERNSHPDAAAFKTLAPASTAAINSMKATTTPNGKSTISRVSSFDGSESSPESKNSALSSSVESNASNMPASSHERTPTFARIRSDAAETPPRWNGNGNGPRVVEHDAPEGAEGAEGWDSTIGKAGLGKTGRVINKLVSDNDALKRDIQIERLRADEAKQAAKLVEDKMERIISDYEGRLLEANVTKTLLARKERQVETLQGNIELEKRKTQAALEREQTWREELDRTRSESTAQVEQATTHAQLLEGRYNAISSHWRDQGDEAKKAVAGLRGEIDGLVEERRGDDDKIRMLRDLCDQQDGNVRELRRENEEMATLFERYKQTQDDDLRGLRTEGRRREVEQEGLLSEAREALDKLRWALNVKENVQGAQ